MCVCVCLLLLVSLHSFFSVSTIFPLSAHFHPREHLTTVLLHFLQLHMYPHTHADCPHHLIKFKQKKWREAREGKQNAIDTQFTHTCVSFGEQNIVKATLFFRQTGSYRFFCLSIDRLLFFMFRYSVFFVLTFEYLTTRLCQHYLH